MEKLDGVCEPVYEADASAVPNQRLVVTPWMLMDQLKHCQEQTEQILYYIHKSGVGAERCCGVWVNPLSEKVEQVHFGVSQLLRLLWRGGLWSEDALDEAFTADGNPYYVLRAPFTDGKPGGRPLPPDAPEWQRELLGLEDQELMESAD